VSTQSVLVTLLGFALLALVVYAGTNAARCEGQPFPSLFVDPFGSYSSISWPTWHAPAMPVRFPDRVIAVDDHPIKLTSRDPPAHQLAELVAASARRGADRVSLTFATAHGPVVVDRRIRRLGIEEATFFFALYAVFVLWSGVAVLVLARRRAGALAYAWWTVGTFGFLVTFFDYHTTARLVPVFLVSVVWVQVCLVWLAYSFPDPPRRHRRLLRPALVVFTAIEIAAALILLVAPHAGVDVTWLRVVLAHSALGSLVVLIVGIVLKLRTELARRRQELISASWGLIAVPASLAAGFGLLAATGTGAVHLFLPFVAPLLPLSIGYAMIRHNILATTALLTRRMFVVPIFTGSTAIALMFWLLLSALLRDRRIDGWIPASAATGLALALSILGYRLCSGLFFRATAKFRPTIQQLADQLASQQQVGEIRRAIEEAVRRWLPTEHARILLADELHEIPNCPTGARKRLEAGETIWTTEVVWRRNAVVPMRSRGELRGALLLAPKWQAALYTGADLELLETIASLGAVALHNADAISELETLRQVQVDAARDEKRWALGLLGAEISHEIAYPLNFLRYLMGQGQAGRPLDPQDFVAGRDEVGRLERMFATLRKLKFPPPQLEPVLILPRALRALDLIRELINERAIVTHINVAPDLTVDAEPDALVQILANLLRNAAQAVQAGQSIGMRALVEADRGVVLEVWDDGPGVSAELGPAIFNPFVTNKEGSMGLGLAVTHRLVRRFGWTITASRQREETTFRIQIPPPGVPWPPRGG
jgi:signal transduction histidine kinase